jgi:acetylornithine deacetylase/succinyl-diaminopimelate desuccinylase-like protein
MTPRTLIESTWRDSIVPTLVDYVRIPAKSPAFDAAWKANGHIDAATRLVADWCRAQPIAGLSVEVIEEPGRTPVIFMEVAPTHAGVTDTVLLYGHLDKQPEMTGWTEGRGPWTPVLDGDKLFGRGGADDGYAAFASLTAIRALQASGRAHARLVILIEASEESGSPDLPHYVERLAPRIGPVSLVVCLDSGCGNYDQLWLTSSLRGILVGTLRVAVLREGVHSGDASGIVPSSFRIVRQLLARLEDELTGDVRLGALHAEIPAARIREAEAVGGVLGAGVHDHFPFVDGMRPARPGLADQILARTWRPALSVVGADGLPPTASAGNVLRPETALRLSLRLPPTLDATDAYALVKQTLEKDPPYGAHVSFEGRAQSGWHAPLLAPWLERSLEGASRRAFERPALLMGEGGSIPFMGMLGARFPAAQFVITGVLGPGSNAHGPNEFLHLPMGMRLTQCVADVVADHAAR